MAGTLKKLWEELDELDIRTADWIDSGIADGDDVSPETPDIVEESVVSGRHRAVEPEDSTDERPEHVEASVEPDAGLHQADAAQYEPVQAVAHAHLPHGFLREK